MTQSDRDENLPGSIEDVPPSPGELLSSAREAAGLTQARMATELGLTEGSVRDIEENRFEKFAAGIYVRGYLRNYGKVLGLDDVELMDIYDQYCLEKGLAEPSNGSSGRAMTAEDRRRLLVGIIIGLIAIGAVGLLIWLANI